MFRTFVLLSFLLFLTGCRKDSGDTYPSSIVMDCNLAVINSVSEASEDVLYTISLTFSDREGNTLDVTAGCGIQYLEAGYYEIGATADGRFDAYAELTADGRRIEVTGGTMYARKNNHEYDIVCELSTEDGDVKCLVEGKKLYFDRDSYPNLSSGGTGTEFRDMTVVSSVLNCAMKYSVCLPSGYDAGREYPVLYILHGMDGGNNDWLNGGAMNAYASKLAAEGLADEMIIICPDGKNLFYCNGYEPGVNYTTYFFEEFIPHVESEYTIRSERGSRAIAGLSMGGYGSLYYGLLHPEMFCQVYACSPAVSVSSSCPNLVQLVSAASASGAVAQLPGITIEIGTEDFLFSGNEAFVNTLDSYNVAYEYITRSGAHTWPFWNACSPKILRKVSAAFEN